MKEISQQYACESLQARPAGGDGAFVCGHALREESENAEEVADLK